MHCADSKFERIRSWLPSRGDYASTPKRPESYSQLYSNLDWSVFKCLTLVPSNSACSYVSFLSDLILLEAASEILVCTWKFLFVVGTSRCKDSSRQSQQFSLCCKVLMQHVSARVLGAIIRLTRHQIDPVIKTPYFTSHCPCMRCRSGHTFVIKLHAHETVAC